jgi:hypothetical protein
LPTSDLWNRAKGNFIDQTDPRFAWTALYSRGVTDATTNTPAPFIRLYIFVLQNRERTQFDGKDLGDASPPGTPVNLQPRMMQPVVFYSPGSGENDLVGFPQAQAPTAAEGAYVVVGRSAGNTYNGEIYRLGLERGVASGGPLNGSYVYELDPAYRLNFPTGSPPIAMFCWMIGRGLSDPTNPSSDFTGPAMDVTLYTTYVKVN